MTHLAHVFAVTLTAVAFIMQVVSIATPNFMMDISTTGVYEQIGLFYYCDGGDCKKLPDDIVPDWGEPVQALAIVGLIGLVFALIIGIVSLCNFYHRYYYVFNIVAAVIAFLAAFFIMVEFSLFHAEKKKDDILKLDIFRLGYSFVFSISAFLLGIAGGVCFLLTLCCKPDY